MEIIKTQVFGFEMALEAMRNPMDSWAKSDSTHHGLCGQPGTGTKWQAVDIGPNDLKLALKLIRGGSEHRKFLRQIIVWVVWNVPRYVWQEIDTYKIATVRNSCSTMHKLGHRDLTVDDFEGGVVTVSTLDALNVFGAAYREKRPLPSDMAAAPMEGYDLVRRMKAILPEAFLQRATMTFSYETLLAMHSQRNGHRLAEWSGEKGICAWIRSLPYMTEFIAANEAGRRNRALDDIRKIIGDYFSGPPEEPARDTVADAHDFMLSIKQALFEREK